jgi:phytoene synthase
MDVVGEQPESREDLLLYCWRVAGVVGVMLCHVFGVSRAEARRHAAHLGMAMQLTNVCRDVLEDWERGRLYVPDELLELHGARSLRERLGQPLPREAATPLSRAIAQLLDEADVLYRSADAGFSALPFRAALGSRIARHVYAAIGHRLRATNCNPFAGRAVVPERTQGALAARAALETLEEWPAVALAEPVELRGTLEFRDVVA